MVRLAVNRVTGEREAVGPTVLVLEGQWLTDMYALQHEEPYTIWLDGAVVLKNNGGRLTVWRNEQQMIEGHWPLLS